MVRIFEWEKKWFGATGAGKKVAGPHDSMGGVVTELEWKGRRFKQRPPPPSWFKGNAGPEQKPQPLKKALKVVAGVAKTVAAVAPLVGKPGVGAIAGTVYKVAEGLSELSVPELGQSLKSMDLDVADARRVLDALQSLEMNGRRRKGAFAAIGAKRRALRG